MDISGLGTFRSGFPFQGTDQAQQGQESGGLARSGQELANSSGRPTDIVALSNSATDQQASRNALINNTSSQPAETGADTVLSRAIGAAFDRIEDDVADMFEGMGLSEDEADAAATQFLDQLAYSATQADEFSFNFEQVIASQSKTDFAYSGPDGVAAGTFQTASMEMKSLDIYVNNNTGEFSINFQQASIEVAELEVASLSESTEGAFSAMNNALSLLQGTQEALGLEGLDALLPGSSGNMLFDLGNANSDDSQGNGFGDFISRILEKTAEAAQGDDEDGDGQTTSTGDPTLDAMLAQQQQLMETAVATIRELQQNVPGPNGESDPHTRMVMDLSVPLGRMVGNEKGALFEDTAGNRSQLNAPETEGVTVEA